MLKDKMEFDTKKHIKNEEECCKDLNKEMKGGIKMERRMFLWMAIGVLLLVALFFAFKTGSVGSTGAVVQSASQSAASASAGMVGGC